MPIDAKTPSCTRMRDAGLCVEDKYRLASSTRRGIQKVAGRKRTWPCQEIRCKALNTYRKKNSGRHHQITGKSGFTRDVLHTRTVVPQKKVHPRTTSYAGRAHIRTATEAPPRMAWLEITTRRAAPSGGARGKDFSFRNSPLEQADRTLTAERIPPRPSVVPPLPT